MNDLNLTQLQNTVHRSFGRCMLKLQQYELLMKSLVTRRELKGRVSQLEKIKQQRVEEFLDNSLGTLIKNFVNGYLTTEDATEKKIFPEHIDNADEPLLGHQEIMQMSAANKDRTKQELKELLDLRNTLAHHFLEKFDIETTDGCSKACDYLDKSALLIDVRFSQLKSWVASGEKAAQIMIAFSQSEDFFNILDGIEPDGVVAND